MADKTVMYLMYFCYTIVNRKSKYFCFNTYVFSDPIKEQGKRH
jgi:hypothetical protein